MVNPFLDVDWNPDRAGRRAFARSLILGFPVMAVLLFVIGHARFGTWDVRPPLLVGGIGVGAGLVFLLLPAIARPFYVVWYALACSIGIVVSNVILAGVFYVIFTGTGLALRLLGRHPLETTIDRSAASYWIDAGPPPEPGRYLRQF